MGMCAKDVLAKNYSPGIWSACFPSAVHGACEGSSSLGAAVCLAGVKKHKEVCVCVCRERRAPWPWQVTAVGLRDLKERQSRL